MSTPAANWSNSSTPVGVNSGKAVQALSISKATVGSLAQVQAPRITVPANLYYFKAYGGQSTDANNIADFRVVDPVSSSAFSLTTKKYTAPVNGFYRFSAVCNSAYDSFTHASLRRERGDEIIYLQRVSIKDDYESQGFCLETFLEAGDKVYLNVDDGRLRLQPYDESNFTLSSLTFDPRTTFEGRLVYQTA